MQSKSVKKLVAAGAAVIVLGGAAVGVSVVQAQSTPTPAGQQQNLRDRYTQALADRLHVTVDQLKQAVADARKDVGLPDRGTKPAAPNGQAGPGRRGFPGGAPGGFARGAFGFLGAEADAIASLFKEDR